MIGQYHLKFNPFYEKHDHDLVGVGRKAEVGHILNDVKKAIEGKAPFFIILRGTVGVGKSFTLDVIRRETFPPQKLDGHRLVSAKFDASLGTTPSKYIQYVCTSMFGSLGKENFHVLREELDAIASLRRVSPDDFLKEVAPDFRFAFMNFDAHQELIWSWLTGEKVDLRDLKKIGIKNKIDSPTFALRVIGEFSRTLRLLGYDGILLCIDEAEEIALAGMSRAVQLLTMLKKIFEDSKKQMGTNPEKYAPMIFCIGFTPETYEIISGEQFMEKEKQDTGAAGLSTFLRRVGTDYSLESFTDEDARALVTVLLDKAREAPNGSLEPFNEDTIDYFNSVGRGIPGSIMKFCLVCLDQGSENGDDIITKEKASQYLVESGTISEEMPEETIGDEA